jgi:hypothetical protein
VILIFIVGLSVYALFYFGASAALPRLRAHSLYTVDRVLPTEEADEDHGMSIDDIISATIGEAEDEDEDQPPHANVSRQNTISGNVPLAMSVVYIS